MSEAAFPPIGDYALIGDSRSSALVSRAGAIEWLCWPDYASPSVFAAILDRERGGAFSIGPASQARTSRRYLDDTAILETLFTTADGRFRLVDFMPIPTDRTLQPQREILRLVEALDGTPEVDVHYRPRPDYGRKAPRIASRGRLGWLVEHRGQTFRLTSDIPLERNGGDLSGRIRLMTGERRWLTLTHVCADVGIVPPHGAEADRKLTATAEWWRHWTGHCTYRGPDAAMVRRSVITLKLLAHILSGAVIAAPTTSLPEVEGGSSNWDYRYCWLRDASLTLRAFADLGFIDEGAAFLRWLLLASARTHPELQVLYDVYGRTRLHEVELDHLSGYRGARPVRVGNAAETQLQLDVYGQVATAAADFAMRDQVVDSHERRLLTGFGDVVCRRWREPDNGIWEVRGGRRHHTFSKLMCWVALDALLRLYEDGAIAVDAARFASVRDEIRETIETRGFDSELGSFVGVLDEKLLDSALLLMPRYGFIAADDPRMTGTYRHLVEKLGSGGFLRRYCAAFDPMNASEHAFGIVGFWAVDYLARAGRIDEAESRFQALLGEANDLGLFAEETDAGTGQLFGNFPQAFTHVGLISAALALEAARARAHGDTRRSAIA